MNSPFLCQNKGSYTFRMTLSFKKQLDLHHEFDHLDLLSFLDDQKWMTSRSLTAKVNLHLRRGG